MALPDVPLDDRTYQQIFDEALRRIPRYAPEWTDHNPSDPGIALVELFSWMTETILYRLNKVPEKNYLKFLDLIGITLRPPAAARAELTFTPTSKNLSFPVAIDAGAKAALSASSGDGPVVFETVDALYVVGAEVKAVQTSDGANFQDVTEANNVFGQSFRAFGRSRPRDGSALYLGLDRPFPPGPFEYRLRVHAAEPPDRDHGQSLASDAAFPGEADLPPVSASWEYYAGPSAVAGVAQGWVRLGVVSDSTRFLQQTGDVVFRVPADRPMTPAKLGLLKRDADPALYWIRFRIDRVIPPGYESAPVLEDVVLNTVDAIQAESVGQELLGASDGRPSQTFTLANRPILPDTLSVSVAEDPTVGFVQWTEVPDFSGSGPDDPHYAVDLIQGLVQFGDGVRGRIPLVYPGDPAVPIANVRADGYRKGGGARGNAGANTITSLIGTIPFVASVTNLRPSVLGQDAETVDEAKARAPGQVRSLGRAITAGDLEFHARQTPGARVRRAAAIPLYRPDFTPRRAGDPPTQIPAPGVVTVVVVPDAPDEPAPTPSHATLQAVADYLRTLCPVTTELYVIGPRYREISIQARVVADPRARGLEKALEERINAYLDPLRGGPDGQGWPFGGRLYLSDVLRQLLETPGVAAVEMANLVLFADGVRVNASEDVHLDRDQLIRPGTHAFVIEYQRS